MRSPAVTKSERPAPHPLVAGASGGAQAVVSVSDCDQLLSCAPAEEYCWTKTVTPSAPGCVLGTFCAAPVIRTWPVIGASHRMVGSVRMKARRCSSMMLWGIQEVG